MSLKNCSINFYNRPDSVFNSGETVFGVINLILIRSKICDGLILNVSGSAKVHWDEYLDPKSFIGKECFFEINQNLLCPERTPEITEATRNTELYARNHMFGFSFKLPKNLPTSLKDELGRIKYKIKVILKRSFKFDLSYKQYFKVLSVVDLNHIPKIQLPITDEVNKTFYLMFSNKGTLNMKIYIPHSGYVPGQIMPISCTLKNDSEIKINIVKLALRKIILFTAIMPRKKVNKKKIEVEHCAIEGIDCKDEKISEILMTIPFLPANSFEFSSIIEVKYDLLIKAVASGTHVNLKTKIPIIIGTIPLQQLPVEIPPPTYEEASGEM